MRRLLIAVLAALILTALVFSVYASQLRRHRIAIVAEIVGVAPRQVQPIWQTFPLIGYAFEIRTPRREPIGYVFLHRSESLHMISFLVKHGEIVPPREVAAGGTESARRMVTRYFRVSAENLRATRLPPRARDKDRAIIEVHDAAGRHWVVQEYAGRLVRAETGDATVGAGN